MASWEITTKFKKNIFRLSITSCEIEEFVEGKKYLLVKHRKNLQDIYEARESKISEKTENLWETDVDDLLLNFEISDDDLGSLLI